MKQAMYAESHARTDMQFKRHALTDMQFERHALTDMHVDRNAQTDIYVDRHVGRQTCTPLDPGRLNSSAGVDGNRAGTT